MPKQKPKAKVIYQPIKPNQAPLVFQGILIGLALSSALFVAYVASQEEVDCAKQAEEQVSK